MAGSRGRVYCFMVVVGLVLGSWVVMAGPAVAQTKPDYKNPALPVEARVRDLLPRMSMEEKIAQLQGTWQNRQQVPPELQDKMFVGFKGEFVPQNAAVTLKYGLGQMSRPSENRGPPELYPLRICKTDRPTRNYSCRSIREGEGNGAEHWRAGWR